MLDSAAELVRLLVELLLEARQLLTGPKAEELPVAALARLVVLADTTASEVRRLLGMLRTPAGPAGK